MKISGLTGQPPDSAEVEVVNAGSFDTLANITVSSNGAYTAHVLGPQQVKLLVIATVDGLLRPAVVPGCAGLRGRQERPGASSGTKTVGVILD